GPQGAPDRDLRGSGAAALPGPVLRVLALREEAGRGREEIEEGTGGERPLLHREGAAAYRAAAGAGGGAGGGPRPAARRAAGGGAARAARGGHRRRRVRDPAPRGLLAARDAGRAVAARARRRARDVVLGGQPGRLPGGD